MHISPSAQLLLKLMFAACSAAITRPRLERQSRLAPAELERSLDELGRIGLLDPLRLRLTMSGLALGAAFSSRSKAEPRRRGRRARPATAFNPPIPLFSRREAPRAVA